MKVLITIGIILCYLSMNAVTIHLRTDSQELRKKKGPEDELKDLSKVAAYDEFVKRLKKDLEDKDFRESLRKTIKENNAKNGPITLSYSENKDKSKE